MYEELTTFLAQVEAVLNSRPIRVLSDDPSDAVALPPGHLLTGQSLIAPPETDLSGSKVCCLSRYRRHSLLRRHFWDEWRATNISKKQWNSKIYPFLQKYDSLLLNIKLLQVGRRLSKSDLPFYAKYPLLLTKSSHFIKIYFRNLHLSQCQLGPKALIVISCEKIWVVNVWEVARKVVRDCVPCVRFKPRWTEKIMADLPIDRVSHFTWFVRTDIYDAKN